MTTKTEKFLNSFTKGGKPVKDLSRIKGLLEMLGNPQKDLQFIHIAGTNGKGSIAQMFSEILICASLRVGLFTSPYLIEYNDRIRINDENIPNDKLDHIVNALIPIVERTNHKEDFSQFEISTCIAFLYFKSMDCDVVVLETGLGGLLDCTNCISSPIVSCIGSVDFDHTAILGKTLTEIATQKAGIIKDNCPAVLSDKNADEVVRVFQDKAEDMKSNLTISDLSNCEILSTGINGSRFIYKGIDYSLKMSGRHQIENAITVIEGMEYVKKHFNVTLENIQDGLWRTTLVARQEIISENPLLILDGGHNPDGTKSLAQMIIDSGISPCHGVIGMLADKNCVDAVKNLIPYVDEFICVDGFYPREISSTSLAQIINENGGKATVFSGDLLADIDLMCNQNPNGINLICGSLFLASHYKTLGRSNKN